MEVQMRIFVRFLAILFAVAVTASPAPAQKLAAKSPKILSAQRVYFEDWTGAPAVGMNAVAQLKKWGRFEVVQDRKQADLILLLSLERPGIGPIIFSGGQTGTVDPNGKLSEDSVPNYGWHTSDRYACLTLFDPKTGERLWSASRQWGGLLTGFNSAGARLIKELEKQIKK
jgi:hypothetical protein